MSQAVTKPRRKCPVVTIANPKGGVGKTTTVINLAHALGIRGKRVLVIDLDPLCHASINSGVSQQEPDAYIEGLLSDPAVLLHSIVRECTGYNILPAGPKLYAYANCSCSEIRFASFLDQLADIRQYYDLVIIDTPPGEGVLAGLGLALATHVVVPFDSSPCSIRGWFALVRWLDRLGNSGSVLAGLLTQVESSGSEHRIRERLEEQFQYPIFETFIRKSSQLSEAAWRHSSIFGVSMRNTAAAEYFDLSAELLEHLT